MRMRTGRFRARVVRAIGVETKYVDNTYATVAVPAFSDIAGLAYALVDINSQGAASGSVIGRHIFCRSIQLIYSVRAGYTVSAGPVYTYQGQPFRVRMALLRVANPGAASLTVIPYPGRVWYPQTGTLSGLDGTNLLHLPRRVQDAGPNPGISPSQIKVLKTWTHTVKPWDNLANTFQDIGDRDGKTWFTKKKIIKVNTDMRINDTSFNASSPWFPQYWLIAWRDDIYPFTVNQIDFPQISLFTRMSYYDV